MRWRRVSRKRVFSVSMDESLVSWLDARVQATAVSRSELIGRAVERERSRSARVPEVRIDGVEFAPRRRRGSGA